MAISLQLVMAQLDFLVGDIPGNAEQVIAAAEQASAESGADVVVFPELTLTGYPPEDLLLRPSLRPRIEKALAAIMAATQGLDLYLVLGYPRHVDEAGDETRLLNMAGVIYRGALVAEYAKQQLPNYQVFDEKRYFTAGHDSCVLDIKGVPVALTVCEDIWHEQPVSDAAAQGAKLMLNLNASPFHCNKLTERQQLLSIRARENHLPIVYVNLVGGQDELVYDGGSMVVDAAGEIQVQAPNYEAGLFPVELKYDPATGDCEVATQQVVPPLSLTAHIYNTLVLGVRDYVNKNGFKGVVLGLSGGIDSAVTLAVAVDALGAERVEAIMMPFRYTSQMSIEDAAEEAATLGIRHQVISIEPMYDTFMAALADEFVGLPADVTEQNIQARCRGVILMAVSNKKGYLVLTTGNKSENAVGYCTLYGDMAGGFDVLKDVPKLMVYELARYRNTLSADGAAVIPERVITRPPSAELAPDQKDEDSLPPYEILDQILELYVEQDLSAHAIVERGFDQTEVNRVIRLVDINEYKRRQSPVGVRITQRGFGKDRRYPITSGWKIGE